MSSAESAHKKRPSVAQTKKRTLSLIQSPPDREEKLGGSTEEGNKVMLQIQRMVDALSEKCFLEERELSELEWRLSNEMHRSRQLAGQIEGVEAQLDIHEQALEHLCGVYLPHLSRKLARSRTQTDPIPGRIETFSASCENAQKEYKSARREARYIESYLQWKNTKWYIKVHKYLRGERTFDWKTAIHARRQIIIAAIAWTGGITVLILLLSGAIFLWGKRGLPLRL